MRRFYTLGRLELVQSGDFGDLTLPMQPKRVALLAYLVVAAPGAFHRRDKLLALLWPELGQDEARRALRQALHYLRRHLGDDTVLTRADDQVGVAASFWCDATELMQAAEERPADALALHRGDFLDGVFIANVSPEFEQWVESTRARLREIARECACRAASERNAAGCRGDATALTLRALELAPDDERSLRRAMRQLLKDQDLGAALRLYDAFARRLELEYGAAPSPETQHLAAALRTAPASTPRPGPAPHTDPMPDSEAGSAPNADAPPASAAPAPAASRGRHRHRALRALIAASLAVLVVFGVTRLARGTSSTDAAVGAGANGRTAAEALVEQALRTRNVPEELPIALSLLTAAMQHDPSYALAALHAAETASQMGRLDSGSVLFARAESLAATTKREADRLYVLASITHNRGQPEAVDYARQLVRRFPRDRRGSLVLGTTLLWRGDYGEAISQLRQVIDGEDGLLTHDRIRCTACHAYAQLVTAYWMTDSSAAAVRTALEWSSRAPDSDAPARLLSSLMEDLESVPEAAPLLAQLEQSEHRGGARSFRAMRVALRRRQFARAESLITAFSSSPDIDLQRRATWLQVILYRNQGRFEEAASAAARVREIAPTLGAAIHPFATPQAVVLLESGHPHAAAALLDTMYHALPANVSRARAARDQAWLLTLRAHALAATGDTVRLPQLADSIRLLGARSGFGRDVRLHHHVRGLLEVARGDLAAAEREFRSSIFSPVGGFTRSNVELADVLIALERHQDAIPFLQSALRAPLDGPAFFVTRRELHARLAEAFRVAGRADSARVHIAVSQ